MEPPPLGRGALDPVRPAFRALARTVVPEAGRLGEAEWRGLEEIVERALASRPSGLRRQLRLLIRILNGLPVLRWGRPFTRLHERHRVRFLEAIQESRLFMLRRGFWGLRTLVFMGYYLRPGATETLGYRAHPQGWRARPGGLQESPRSIDAAAGASQTP